MKWNGSEDEWDPTMGTNTFLAHIEQVQLERLSMIPNSIMNFANLTTMNDTIVPKTTAPTINCVSDIPCPQMPCSFSRIVAMSSNIFDAIFLALL